MYPGEEYGGDANTPYKISHTPFGPQRKTRQV